MKKANFSMIVNILVVFILFSCKLNIKDDEKPLPGEGEIQISDYIIADHSIVDKYVNIPQVYIDIIKTWLVDAAGESHSAAYRTGLTALEALDPRFQVTTFTYSFPAVTTEALRLGRHGSVGEGDFWTNEAARQTIEGLISTQETANNPIHVLFQAWCWDFTRATGAAGIGSGDYDSEYGCHWYGSSVGGPDGDHIWGIDGSDFSITGNNVSLQTYLDTIDRYNNYAANNNFKSIAIFTTGPVDNGSSASEPGYQRYIKHSVIRDYVSEGNNRILFDYADILAYNNSNERHLENWTSPNTSQTYEFPAIHPDNAAEETGHIANLGALRLAKAMWWLLARMAGWDGN